MKHILTMLISIMLLGSGLAIAGELKVMVPVDDFKNMSRRLEILEQENNQLKQAVNSAGGVAASGQETMEIQSRLESMEQENSRLRQQIQAMQTQGSAASAQPASEMTARINSLEQENSMLQKQVADMKNQKQASSDDSIDNRLVAAEAENSQLKQQVKSLKEGGMSASMVGNKSTARQMYATGRHVSTFHNFKF